MIKSIMKIFGYLFIISFLLAFRLVIPKSAYAYGIGWYTNDPSTNSQNNLTTYASQGATLMLPYNCYNDQTGTAAYLTKANTLGIKVWVDLRLHVNQPSETDWKNFINKFKTYPAVKGWYIADEPEYSGPDYATILKYYQWTKQVDAVHPVSIAHAWTVKSSYASPTRPYEVLLMDVYPGWGYPNNDTVEFNANIRESYKWWLQGKQAADSYGVPIEAVALGFGYKPGTTTMQNYVRDLTNAEHRWHVYSAVALGYEGVLFWWDMNNPSWVQTNDNNKNMAAQRFSEMSQISTQMDKGITNSGITVSVPTSKLIYRFGTDNNQSAILAVNIAGYNVSNNGEVLNSVQFTLPTGTTASWVNVIGENRTIPVTNRVFSDNFNRFDVHIYKFTNNSNPNPSPSSNCLKIGDINCDNVVNMLDIGLIISAYGSSPPTKIQADLNNDNKIDFSDVKIGLMNYLL